MRRMIDFDCCGDVLVGTLDEGAAKTGLMIVSGGNEVRSGAYAGQSVLAQHFASKSYPVFRFDRRGVGDSEGNNGGFESSADDIAAAVSTFRAQLPQIDKLVAFGNCDAATALALFHQPLRIDSLVLANPWVIETTNAEPDSPTQPSASAIRARYLARLKNPGSLIDLLTGKIDLKKLADGLAKAAHKEVPTGLAARLASALAASHVPTQILLAERDTTALAFLGVYKDRMFDTVRARNNAILTKCASASHSFANPAAKSLLISVIEEALTG